MNKEERTETIIRLREEGFTYKQIANRVNCCNQTVYKTLSRAEMTDEKKSTNRISDETREEVIEMRREGKTYMKIELLLEKKGIKISSVSINKILRKEGLTRSKS